MEGSRADVEAVRAVVEVYVDACSRADPDALRGALHPAWTMYGVDALAVDVATCVDDFVEWVSTQQAPDDYHATIAQVDVAGDAAIATLLEVNYYGVDYTTFFTLVRYDGVWRITTKTHSQIPPAAPRT